jgi:hypothetical protein
MPISLQLVSSIRIIRFGVDLLTIDLTYVAIACKLGFRNDPCTICLFC